MNSRVKIIIIILVALLSVYIIWSINSFVSQDAEYTTKSEMMSVLDENFQYFDDIVNFFKNYEYKYILYDLSSQSFVYGLTKEEESVIQKLFSELSFNYLEKDGDSISFVYCRPFNHSVNVGLKYDYITKEWTYIYYHNYKRCSNGHLNGYWFYDVLLNK